MAEGNADFRVDVERPSEKTAVVTVVGDADLYSAPELRDELTALIADGAGRILVDLSETTFVDSMALGVLLGTMKRLRAKGGRLELVVPTPDIRRILEITMLDRVFQLYSSRADAIGSSPQSVAG